jgi:hypothetical protein
VVNDCVGARTLPILPLLKTEPAVSGAGSNRFTTPLNMGLNSFKPPYLIMKISYFTWLPLCISIIFATACTAFNQLYRSELVSKVGAAMK